MLQAIIDNNCEAVSKYHRQYKITPHHFDYAITLNRYDMVKTLHSLGYRGTHRAIALAIGWDAMECLQFLLTLNYPINKEAMLETSFSRNPEYSRIMSQVDP
jgi:hypothetical protein